MAAPYSGMSSPLALVDDRSRGRQLVGELPPGLILEDALASAAGSEPGPPIEATAIYLPVTFSTVFDEPERPRARLAFTCEPDELICTDLSFESTPEWTICDENHLVFFEPDQETGEIVEKARCPKCGNTGRVLTGRDAPISKETLETFPLARAVHSSAVAAADVTGHDKDGVERIMSVSHLAGVVFLSSLEDQLWADDSIDQKRIDPVIAAAFRAVFDEYLSAYRRLRPRRGRGATITDEFLTGVAATYRAAMERGEPPTKAVMETYITSRPTAGRWVHQARARGLLGKTTPRKPGEEL
jgi:hypothetical protein